MIVPKLTFMYRSGLYRYFVCTEGDCTDIDFQCTETGCTEKKHVPKVYVPKLSCTESDLPLRKSGSRNRMVMSELEPEVHKWPFLRMRSENMAKNCPKCCQIAKI